MLRLPLEIVVGERSTVNKDITQIVEVRQCLFLHVYLIQSLSDPIPIWPQVHEEADKFMRLLQLLGVWYEKGSVLVFVDTQVPTTPYLTL